MDKESTETDFGKANSKYKGSAITEGKEFDYSEASQVSAFASSKYEIDPIGQVKQRLGAGLHRFKSKRGSFNELVVLFYLPLFKGGWWV